MIDRCVLFFGIFCLLAACAYEPEGEYVNPSIYRPLDNIPASINIDDLKGEFALVFRTSFHFSVDRVGKPLIYCKVSSEGKEISVGNLNDQYSFLIDPEQLSNGTHEYDIEVKLSSGSGSIAESLGVEYYLIQKKLVVSVDKSIPEPVTGLTATMVDGYMTLTWNKPSHNHYKYSIFKLDENDNFLDAFDISNASLTSYVDKGYVGGKVSYHVALVSSFFQVDSEYVVHELQPIEVVPVLDGDNHLKIKWNVLTVFGEDVTIRISGRHFTKDFPWESDESNVDSLYLGDIANANLKVFRNGFDDQGLSVTSAHSIGTKIKSFYSYSFIEASNKILFYRATGPSKIHRYDATTFASEDSLYHPGNYLISSESGMRQYLIYSWSNAYSFNPMNFSESINGIDLNSIYRQAHGSDTSYPVYFNISNDNLLVFTDQNQFGGPKVVTMDLTTKQPFGTDKNGVKADISGDGHFMVVTNSYSEEDAVVYKRGASDWEEIGKIPFGRMFFSRDPGNRLVRSHQGTTYVYDLISSPDANGYFTEVKSAQINATGLDRVSNRIIQEIIDDKFVSSISTYSVDDLTLMSTHKARVTPNMGDQHFVVGNKQIVASGYIRDIE
jgi:hypothetical protein